MQRKGKILVGYLTSIWDRRFLWISQTQMDLRERYHGSVIGLGWALLHPLAMMAILSVVFANLFGLGVRDYAPFLLSGLVFWTFITSSVSRGCHIFIQAEPFIRQHPAPLAIYPLRVALGATFHLGAALLMLVALNWVVGTPPNPLALLSMLPLMAAMLILSWSLSTLAGLVNTYFRDFQYISELGLQTLFYATPILYPPQMLRERNLGWVIDLNPLFPLLELIRKPLVEATVPSPGLVLAGILATGILAGAACAALARSERGLIFEL